MFFLLKKIITALIMPPMCLVTLSLVGLLIMKKWKRLGMAFILTGLVSLLALSMPLVSHRLMMTLQENQAVTSYDAGAQAIVILGAGVYNNAPEYGGRPNLSGYALERVKYGAYLFDKTGLPILVTGGDPVQSGVNEGDVMKQVLEEELMTPVTWVEGSSRDTFENARYSYEILSRAGQTRIYLVTHNWHMPRARLLFEHFGFDVIPAPTMVRRGGGRISLLSLLPNVSLLETSTIALREWVGQLWYRLRLSLNQ